VKEQCLFLETVRRAQSEIFDSMPATFLPLEKPGSVGLRNKNAALGMFFRVIDKWRKD